MSPPKVQGSPQLSRLMWLEDPSDILRCLRCSCTVAGTAERHRQGRVRQGQRACAPALPPPSWRSPLMLALSWELSASSPSRSRAACCRRARLLLAWLRGGGGFACAPVASVLIIWPNLLRLPACAHGPMPRAPR